MYIVHRADHPLLAPWWLRKGYHQHAFQTRIYTKTYL